MDGTRGHWHIEEEVQLLRNAVYRLEVAGIEPADVGIVLGSGLKQFAELVDDALTIPFNEIPEFPSPRVRGHGGDLLQGKIGHTRVHCLSGRVHIYEGYHSWEVVRAVRSLAMAGTKTFILTNAAGGIREDLKPGTLMVIRDHINMTARNVLRGDHHESLGPRFPAMSEVYCKKAGAILHEAADEPLADGCYVQVSGPSYETPAEIRMLRTLGGDAVGMSTVPEAVALRAMDCRVAGISLITNLAAGLSKKPPNHAEVVEEGERAGDRICRLLERAIPAIGHLDGRRSRKTKDSGHRH